MLLCQHLWLDNFSKLWNGSFSSYLAIYRRVVITSCRYKVVSPLELCPLPRQPINCSPLLNRYYQLEHRVMGLTTPQLLVGKTLIMPKNTLPPSRWLRNMWLIPKHTSKVIRILKTFWRRSHLFLRLFRLAAPKGRKLPLLTLSHGDYLQLHAL